MSLGDQARAFRETFNQEILDNLSRYGFIKKQLWDMQVGLINEESCEFLRLQKKCLQTLKTLTFVKLS